MSKKVDEVAIKKTIEEAKKAEKMLADLKEEIIDTKHNFDEMLKKVQEHQDILDELRAVIPEEFRNELQRRLQKDFEALIDHFTGVAPYQKVKHKFKEHLDV